MAGRGPAPKPKPERRNRHRPGRGEWKAAEAVGWQHGEIPPAPGRLLKVSRETWGVWFRAWWAAHWTPEDLPMLRQIIHLYDLVERGRATAAQLAQFRQLVDTYGITPKGQQDRRWKPPEQPEEGADPPTEEQAYGHLRPVN